MCQITDVPSTKWGIFADLVHIFLHFIIYDMYKQLLVVMASGSSSAVMLIRDRRLLSQAEEEVLFVCCQKCPLILAHLVFLHRY